MTANKNQHIYNLNKWQRLAKRVIREEPTCWLRLPGCTIRATVADHIIPVSTNPALALVRSNCRGACRSCNTLRGSTPITQLAGLRARVDPRPMTRQQALAIIRSNRLRQRAPALRIFD
jgi:5-methylcytosine-specific restriction endonuclease McrA